jgi:hypothetical protein
MSLDMIVEVWETLRSHVDSNDRKDAADSLINLLIDHNYEGPDIKDAFKGDKDVIGALKYYLEQHEQDEEYEDDDYSDGDEDDENY